MTVHHQAVFVSSGRQNRFLVPMAGARGMQGFAFGLPMVETPRDTNRVSRRVSEFKANGHQLGTGAVGVVMIVVMFHNCGLLGLIDAIILLNIYARDKMATLPSVRERLRVMRRFHLALAAILVRVARFGEYVVPLWRLGTWRRLLGNRPHAVQCLRENWGLRRFRSFAVGGFHKFRSRCGCGNRGTASSCVPGSIATRPTTNVAHRDRVANLR
jgi:hypothetical protein